MAVRIAVVPSRRFIGVVGCAPPLASASSFSARSLCCTKQLSITEQLRSFNCPVLVPVGVFHFLSGHHATSTAAQ